MPVFDLPDLFTFTNGQRLTSLAGWPARRQELMNMILQIEYGQIPPAAPVHAESLKTHPANQFGEAQHTRFRLVIATNPQISFELDLLIPISDQPRPVVLNGDACWSYITDEIAQLVLRRGYILATFDRTKIVPDAPDPMRKAGLYAAFERMDFGALAAWAWGYYRAVDFLLTLPEVDRRHIAITGHSRGGKSVLLAGATDERIALTNPNDSGCGGTSCYRRQAAGSETLADILRRFPFWFSPRFSAYLGRETELPFDQHSLKALVAPRCLLDTEALGDLWANPSGAWHTHVAAQVLYGFLGAEDKIAIWYREGQHEHSLADFTALLDFTDGQFFGRPLALRYNQEPAWKETGK